MSGTAQQKSVAYFCAEFGIDSNTPTYAGGLGILAGDTLKQAADEDYPMTGIGLLYRGQYFIQRFDQNGWQHEEVSLYDPASACLRIVTKNGNPLYVVPKFAGVEVHIKAYQIRVGEKTNLYLLSSDSHKNPEDWRQIMAENYWGDPETQFRQQLVLGIGGMMMLRELGINPQIYHFNEGRPSLAIWGILTKLMKDEGLNFEDACQKARSQIIYTNHTLLRAGNLRYDLDLVKKYASDYASELDIDTDALISPGKIADSNQFGISEYALSFAGKASSVSTPHQKLSEQEWPEYKWINVTNGVHLPSWQAVHFKDPNLSNEQIWHVHNQRKHELMELVARRSGFGYDPNRLVISWARRMAAYKQLDILFADLARLKSIMANADHPVQLLVAGKAHPGDDAAKEHIQQTIKAFADQLNGYAIFVPNYDIALARAMVSGSDVWLNTPQWGREACGTSGMKAISNGVLNCTIADGWAAEVDWDNMGWVLDHTKVSECFYDTLQNSIVPKFYNRGNEGLPLDWIAMMKKSIAVSKQYSTERMFNEYKNLLYK